MGDEHVHAQINHGGTNIFDSLFWGKDVALVGNSRTLFKTKWPIDGHQLVVRMNRAWAYSSFQKKRAGRRVDVLLASMEKHFIHHAANASPHLIWMTPKHRDQLPHLSNLFFYPLDYWEELFLQLGSRPSTGCMGVDLISRHLGPGSLTLYGFDFFRTPNWYRKKKQPFLRQLFSWHRRESTGLKERIARGARQKHSPNQEESYIKNCLPPSQLQIYPPG